MNTATVIGLGTMGATLARLLLKSGYGVTVWNRTPAKAEALKRDGAMLASSASAALRASPLTVMCVHDYHAAGAILAGVDDGALAGRVLVHLSTGSPKDARGMDAWARKHGARFLAGTIQAAPAQMGQPDTPILLSGSEETFRAAERVLKVLAGNLTYLGSDAGAAAAMDAATLSYVYGAMLGFTHGARICEAQGFGVDQYGAIVAAISPSFGEFFRHEGKVIQSGDFRITESPMRISIEATARLEHLAREMHINAEVPAFIAGLFKRAEAAGLADEEAAALIKLLRG